MVFMKRGFPYEKGGFQYYLKQHETNGMENNRTPSPFLQKWKRVKNTSETTKTI